MKADWARNLTVTRVPSHLSHDFLRLVIYGLRWLEEGNHGEASMMCTHCLYCT